jgi:hypothetical protein
MSIVVRFSCILVDPVQHSKSRSVSQKHRDKDTAKEDDPNTHVHHHPRIQSHPFKDSIISEYVYTGGLWQKDCPRDL